MTAYPCGCISGPNQRLCDRHVSISPKYGPQVRPMTWAERLANEHAYLERALAPLRGGK